MVILTSRPAIHSPQTPASTAQKSVCTQQSTAVHLAISMRLLSAENRHCPGARSCCRYSGTDCCMPSSPAAVEITISSITQRPPGTYCWHIVPAHSAAHRSHLVHSLSEAGTLPSELPAGKLSISPADQGRVDNLWAAAQCRWQSSHPAPCWLCDTPSFQLSSADPVLELHMRRLICMLQAHLKHPAALHLTSP